MRRLIWLIVIVAALWSGWWWIATNGLQNALQAITTQQETSAPRLSWSALTTGGYPFKVRANLRDVTVFDPNGATINLEQIKLTAPTHWPGDIKIDLPATPIEIALPQGAFLIRANDAVAAAYLQPTPALTLKTASLTSANWQLNTTQGNVMTATGLNLFLRQDAANPAQYHADVQAAELTPGDLVRVPLQLTDAWPLTLESTRAQMSVTFQAPLDRRSGEMPPQVHQIALKNVDVLWGPASLRASGDVHLSADGVPDGEVRLQVGGWPELLNLAVNAGLIPANRRGQAETLLRALSNIAGDAQTLDLTLRFENGQMALGPIALGPAPRLFNP